MCYFDDAHLLNLFLNCLPASFHTLFKPYIIAPFIPSLFCVFNALHQAPMLTLLSHSMISCMGPGEEGVELPLQGIPLRLKGSMLLCGNETGAVPR